MALLPGGDLYRKGIIAATRDERYGGVTWAASRSSSSGRLIGVSGDDADAGQGHAALPADVVVMSDFITIL
jgi:hypothetical protein